ncbi:hypothetical protein GPECTOR_657g779 [Gonium pectorale]|uniref:Uncharacterized protein n=1 Tax=Gonium pectorale TaxID=33097 RepID=A0A150FUA6_GONPE|nr:hypothetical protein GPECTOR_657g779 [Gonium pectorale]|eukprot:KXZ41201.1 hypothetical protein GPECTOR_657g779 [Gonium pectorale]
MAAKVAEARAAAAEKQLAALFHKRAAAWHVEHTRRLEQQALAALDDGLEEQRRQDDKRRMEAIVQEVHASMMRNRAAHQERTAYLKRQQELHWRLRAVEEARLLRQRDEEEAARQRRREEEEAREQQLLLADEARRSGTDVLPADISGEADDEQDWDASSGYDSEAALSVGSLASSGSGGEGGASVDGNDDGTSVDVNDGNNEMEDMPDLVSEYSEGGTRYPDALGDETGSDLLETASYITDSDIGEDFVTLQRDDAEHRHIQPKRWYIDFGLEETIKHLAQSDDFADKFGTGMDTTDQGSHYSLGTAWRNMNYYTRRALADPRNGMYAVHFDFVEPFKSVTHATGVATVQTISVPLADRGKAFTSAPLAIVKGPKQPNNLPVFFKRTFESFERLATQGMTLTIPPPLRRRSPNRARLARTIVHFAFLFSWLADTPARTKSFNFVGVNARVGACAWCLWLGAGVPNAGGVGTTTRFLGYNEPCPQLDRRLGEVRVGDPRLRLNNDKYISRGRLVHAAFKESNAAGLRAKKKFGAVGVLPVENLARRLDPESCAWKGYLNVQDLLVVPTAHALLFGVVQNFLDVIFRDLPVPPDQQPFVISKPDRRTVELRAQHISVTSDFGRKYRDIMTYR